MLTPHDDFPIHQTSLPIAHPASGSPNHYDRYWFNGYPADGSFYFGIAMGHYPNRAVIDGAFSLVRGGTQRSVFASGRMPLDRHTAVGPLSIDVLEPLRRLRVTVAPNEHGLAADLEFDAVTVAVEEPRQSNGREGRLGIDSTRLTQWGRWSGWIEVDGERIELDPATTFATRDRSWGERSVGAPTPTNVAPSRPQLAFLWAPMHLPGTCAHVMSFETESGHKWAQTSRLVPHLAPGEPTWGTDPSEHLNGFDLRLDWKRGTREIAAARLTMPRLDGTSVSVEFEPLLTFRMRGIGYQHPVFGHGSAHGDLEVGDDVLVCADVNPLDPSMVHVQTLSRLHSSLGEGIGILEQFVVGEHRPSGLTGILDGYSG